VEDLRISVMGRAMPAATMQNYEQASQSARRFSQYARDSRSHSLAADFHMKAARVAQALGRSDMACYHYGYAGHHEKMARVGFNALGADPMQ
jgi:hypothetical protein